MADDLSSQILKWQKSKDPNLAEEICVLVIPILERTISYIYKRNEFLKDEAFSKEIEKLWSSYLPRFNGSSKFETYLSSAVKNDMIDLLRKGKRQEEVIKRAYKKPLCAFYEECSDEFKKAVDSCVESFSEEDQKIWKMYESGESYFSILKKENISKTSLKMKLYRMRSRLRNHLSQYF